MGTENASSSCFPSFSTSAPRWTYEYDVFLSFRGADTRKKFTSHLYEALKRNGIITFRDDESLDRGAFIKPELLKAIEESKIAVVIFSRDYASSSWCLTELAKVYECLDKKKLTVLPVFHDVDPSDVRKLRGTLRMPLKNISLITLRMCKLGKMLWRKLLVSLDGIYGMSKNLFLLFCVLCFCFFYFPLLSLFGHMTTFIVSCILQTYEKIICSNCTLVEKHCMHNLYHIWVPLLLLNKAKILLLMNVLSLSSSASKLMFWYIFLQAWINSYRKNHSEDK